VDFASACLDGGARFLQVRGKGMASGALLDVTLAMLDRARGREVSIIVNDRADVARLAGAAGVHVGQEDLAPADARRVLGGQATIGLSTHTPAQLDAGIGDALGEARVTYLALGPIFATTTKTTGYEAVGLDRVREAAARTRPNGVPLVAIGGITLETAPGVIEAGAAAVAVIGDLLTTGDPAARVAQFLSALR
jgi:thiamine-phosphate pyrophosphorylase